MHARLLVKQFWIQRGQPHHKVVLGRVEEKCEQHTSHVSFVVLHSTHFECHTGIGSSLVCVAHFIHFIPSSCAHDVVVFKFFIMETGKIMYEKVCASPRPPPKISFKDNWMKELGSEVCWTSTKLPTNPTKDTKSNWWKRATCHDRTNVLFECSGNRYTFLT